MLVDRWQRARIPLLTLEASNPSKRVDGFARDSSFMTPWGRLENDQYIMSTGSARPLEDAFRISQVDLIQWIGAEYGLDRLDAYQLVTQAGETPLANVVDPNYTFVSKIRKEYLPDNDVYGGTHTQMKEMGRVYLAERR